MTEAPMLVDVAQPPAPSVFDKWSGERDYLFKPVEPKKPKERTRRAMEEWNRERTSGHLLYEAHQAITETAQIIWQRPESEHVEIADRVSIGVYSDPVGDTVADERRIALRNTVDQLINDPRRSKQWRRLVVETNEACIKNGLPPIAYRPDRRPDTDLGRWLFERNIMLEYCAQAPYRIQILNNLDNKSIRPLAELFADSNRHLDRRLSYVKKAIAKYHGDHIDEP